MNKRSFIRNLTLAGMSIPLDMNGMEDLIRYADRFKPETLATDESFWASVRKGYRLKNEYINLENGYYNFMPEVLLEKYIGHIRDVNFQGSHYMRTVQWDNKKKIAEKLASLTGCGNDELVITRNTTESMDTVISGFHWKAGDEAVMAQQDYGAMLDMFRQVSERHGVVNKVLSIPNHPTSDDEIVSLYAAAITEKTRLLMVCHMINITGQILPIRKICDMAHSRGVQVLVDGAHAIAHIKFRINDLNCDYYAASLHKWLSVPLGAGMLYVNKKNIGQIWPMFADSPRPMDDIWRLNHTGTHPVATDLCISDAIDHYLQLGPERKEERLRYLQQYWTTKVRKLPNVVVNTPEDPARSCGIANVGIRNMKPSVLAETLMKKYRIFTVAIDYANVQGCRITPNVYTSLPELDTLVNAIRELSA